jgi:hypothetical protein
MSKDRKKHREELLGMSTSTAEKKLRKSIILDLARQLHKNICLECGLVIDDPEDLAIKHVENWEGDPAQFFDLTNVAFGHVSCGAGDHGRTQEEESKMRRVEVIVEDQNGVPLRGCVHQGHVYVAGNKDQRYQVRVRNTTGRRLLVVITVDGRNVNTGKKGDVNDSGHVLDPHAQWVFTGWRQSDDKVAAFRLGQKDDAYSAQTGSPENVGVIGVAVFEEKQPERPVITIREKEYVPVPYPVYPSWPRPVTPWDPYHPVWISTPTITLGGTTQTGTGIFFSSGGGSTGSFGVISGTSCSVDSNATSSGQLSSNASETAPRSRGSRQRAHHQELGTEFGESLVSVIRKANFIRATDAPSEVFMIRYDSLDALIKAGIMGRRPSQKHRDAPRAFPESPDVGRGYCEPPPRQRAYKG